MIFPQLSHAETQVHFHHHARRGGLVLGLCGGFQMLGRFVHDPLGLEGNAGTAEGLAMLDVETRLIPDKTLTLATGTHVPTGTAISGYEIHLGMTDGPDCSRPFAMIGDRPDWDIAGAEACARDPLE